MDTSAFSGLQVDDLNDPALLRDIVRTLQQQVRSLKREGEAPFRQSEPRERPQEQPCISWRGKIFRWTLRGKSPAISHYASAGVTWRA